MLIFKLVLFALNPKPLLETALKRKFIIVFIYFSLLYFTLLYFTLLYTVILFYFILYYYFI